MKMQLNQLAWSVAVASVLLITSGCNKPADETAGGGSGGSQSSEPIKVGQFASLTGKEATFGISSDEGTTMAIEEINAAGGVSVRNLKLPT